MQIIPKETHSLLQLLLNNTLKHVRSLNTLGEQTAHWNSILIYLVCSKLDPVTKRDWEILKTEQSQPSTMNDMKYFLTK